MEIESFLKGEIRNINVVDDIFEIIIRKVNLKVLESNCCDENYKILYHTKTELQRQIDLYKSTFNGKRIVKQEQEDKLIELCCKYLELFFAILHFQRINANKIETECIDNIISAQPKVMDIELIAGEEECEMKADVNLENISSKVPERHCHNRNSNQSNLTSENGAHLHSIAKVHSEELRLPLNESNQEEDTIKNVIMNCGDIDEHNKLETSKNLEIYEILLKNKERWICTHCTYLNTFDKNQCEVCDRSKEEVGSWICDVCSFVNTKPFDHCLVCWEVNRNFRENLHENNLKADQVDNEENLFKKVDNKRCQKDNENHFKKEIWKCWYKRCEQLNGEKDIFLCKHCNLARNAPKCEGDLVLRFSKNGMTFSEVWICGMCSYINDKDEIKCQNQICGQFKFYHRTKPEKGGQMKNEEKKGEIWSCDRCSYANNINYKKCKVCDFKKSEVLFMENHWRCWNNNCKQFNKDVFDYCEYCRLTKNFSDEQGDIVTYKDKNGVKDIWVCRKCYKFNDILNYKCKGKGCNNDRFGKSK